MSLNQTMNISLGSMKNNQYALTVVSQNIANLHVEGYHRQRVNFATNEYTTNCENVISTIRGMNGASISSLSDYIDEGAFKGLLDSNADAQYFNTLAGAIGELEDVADDLGDNGLNALLNSFFEASVNLEQFPTDMSIRQQYVIAAQNVCEKFNEISTKFDDIQEDKFKIIQNDVSTINTLLQNLAQANEANAKNGGSSATESEIDGILKELSNYMEVTATKNENNTYNIQIGDIKVVEGNQVNFKLNAEFDSTNPDNAVSFSLQSTQNPDYVIENGVNDSFTTGSMKAFIEFLNGDSKNFTNINAMKENLNTAAISFANALNDIQTKVDDDGTFPASLISNADGSLNLQQATKPMFTTTDGNAINAKNLTVNPEIIENPYHIAAARINLDKYTDENGNVDPNWVKSVGNADNAIRISALRNEKICADANGNMFTLSEFLRNNAAKTGLDAANIATKADTAQDIADMDATNYANMVGVNLDEELADMIKYQRAFEASAKIFSTVNDLMGTIIGMV